MADERNLNESQQLEIEKLRAQAASDSKRAAELRAQEIEAAAQQRSLLANEALNDAIRGSGIRLHAGADETIEQLLRPSLRTEGEAISVEVDGERLPVSEAVAAFVRQHPNFCADLRTLPGWREQHQESQEPQRVTDLPDVAARSRFITERGYDKFEELVVGPMFSGRPKTYAEYMALPPRTRARLALSEDEVTELIRADRKSRRGW